MRPLFQTWPTWASRGLAVILLILLLLVLYRGIAAPISSDLRRLNSEIRQANINLHNFKSRSLDLAQLQKQLKVLQDRKANSPIFLRQNSPDLAGAWLQQRLKAVLQRNNAQIRSMQIISARANTALAPKNKAPIITVRVRFTGGMQTVMRTLHVLEAQTPYLIIPRVEIRSTNRNRVRRARIQTPNVDQNLNVILDVTGFLLPK